MAITHVAHGAVATGSPSASPTFGQATTAGNLVVCICVYTSIGTTSMDLSGWSTAYYQQGATYSTWVWYKADCADNEPAPTITTVSPVASIWAVLAEFNGAGPATNRWSSTSGASGVTPVAATTAGTDVAAGYLALMASIDSLSKAGTVTTSDTFNNGTANDLGNNDATSLTTHYRFSYAITTSNSVADSNSHADNSKNLNFIQTSIQVYGPATFTTRYSNAQTKTWIETTVSTYAQVQAQIIIMQTLYPASDVSNTNWLRLG